MSLTECVIFYNIKKISLTVLHAYTYCKANDSDEYNNGDDHNDYNDYSDGCVN